MASTIIGLSGKKRSGKDTFAEVLVERHGFTRVAFADPMRQAALALDPIVEVETEMGSEYGYGGALYPTAEAREVRLSEVVAAVGWEEAKARPEIRRTLQRLGTEAGRQVLGEDVWVDAAMATIDAIEGPVVVTDVRFRNEAERLVRAGGTVVRIERPDLPESDDQHPSETELDDFGGFAYIVYNQELEDFRAYADFIGEMMTMPLESPIPA